MSISQVRQTWEARSNDWLDGWLTLERERIDQLWRIAAWTPSTEPEPACYRW